MASDSLSERLKSLGVRVGAQDLPRKDAKPLYTIDQVLSGQRRATALGETYIVETFYPADYRHGNTGLSYTTSLKMITEWGRVNHLVDCQPSAFAFLDTETTGLSGGTGTYPFLVGVGRYAEDGFHLIQYLMGDPAEEPALLTALTNDLHPCQAMVTYNGKAFDAPLLNTRFTLQGLTSPLPVLAHLDLLPLARRLWRDRLPSRALSYLEASILGATRTQEEVPGWMIPQVYFDYLRTGDARPLAGVLYHNAMDILALAGLFSRTVEMLANPLELDIQDGTDLVAIARLFEELGYLDTSVLIYRRGLEKGLPEEFFWETVERLSLLFRRRGDWPAAVDLWRKAAQHGQVYAHIELAKYAEHELRDPEEALAWTHAAIDHAGNLRVPGYVRRKLLAELEHRLARLVKKAGQNPTD
jgi:uncharacterized protein YprB with RNaseH-like and TPR domain